jgi:hypothetical protein
MVWQCRLCQLRRQLQEAAGAVLLLMHDAIGPQWLWPTKDRKGRSAGEPHSAAGKTSHQAHFRLFVPHCRRRSEGSSCGFAFLPTSSINGDSPIVMAATLARAGAGGLLSHLQRPQVRGGAHHSQCLGAAAAAPTTRTSSPRRLPHAPAAARPGLAARPLRPRALLGARRRAQPQGRADGDRQRGAVRQHRGHQHALARQAALQARHAGPARPRHH